MALVICQSCGNRHVASLTTCPFCDEAKGSAAASPSGERPLMLAQGSTFLSNSWKQEILLTDRAVYGEVLRFPKRIKMSLPYDRIAQVNITRGVLTADIEVVNKGGSDNLVVRALSKPDAEKAKKLIEERINSPSRSVPPRSLASEIEKLADLHLKGLLSDAEFQTAKQRLLSP